MTPIIAVVGVIAGVTALLAEQYTRRYRHSPYIRHTLRLMVGYGLAGAGVLTQGVWLGVLFGWFSLGVITTISVVGAIGGVGGAILCDREGKRLGFQEVTVEYPDQDL